MEHGFVELRSGRVALRPVVDGVYPSAGAASGGVSRLFLVRFAAGTVGALRDDLVRLGGAQILSFADPSTVLVYAAPAAVATYGSRHGALVDMEPGLAWLAARHEVSWVKPLSRQEPHNAVAGWIVQSGTASAASIAGSISPLGDVAFRNELSTGAAPMARLSVFQTVWNSGNLTYSVPTPPTQKILPFHPYSGPTGAYASWAAKLAALVPPRVAEVIPANPVHACSALVGGNATFSGKVVLVNLAASAGATCANNVRATNVAAVGGVAMLLMRDSDELLPISTQAPITATPGGNMLFAQITKERLCLLHW
ncbi:hypothetical protein HYH03_013635 [Edaphochlamys debaryana]|uniref:Uncharacterized protein n=1 Tax=Edaphochlamys debaryana TaxID=47281 RepID=A0A835XT81_9CHLO|nr:hypothetical protein HYH03_013635 [Edaphochlamys debaryana]|eukprot:KAG2487791.1 hypothetical protein HYH03_013635 [Edaphochlamys debaryana]